MTEQAQQPDSLDGIEYVGMPDKPAPEAAPETAETPEPLELGTPETPEATPDDVAADEEKKKGRSQRWEKRVDTLTARLREAERRAAEAEARVQPATQAEPSAPDPNDERYEYGIADPQYIKDAALFEVRKELAAERKQAAEADQRNAAANEQTARLQVGMAKLEQTGQQKYEDFDAKISEAVEARGGEPLPPLISVGITVSPAGADLAYRLATDEAASDRLEQLAKTNPHSAALAFGELEGEYLDSDDDLNPADPLDMLRLNGRMKARLAGKRAPDAAERKVSKAPEPPTNTARGAGGRFTPDWSSEGADLNELGKLLK